MAEEFCMLSSMAKLITPGFTKALNRPMKKENIRGQYKAISKVKP